MDEWRSTNWSQAGFIVLGAYLLGCFATGYYLVRWRMGRDVRDLGSGNIGARNVGRLLGRSGFWLTVLGDFGKGALAVWLAGHFTSDARLALLAMVAVVAGHIWPLQLHFRGGKGMATSLGALLVYDWRLAVVFGVVFLGGWLVLRKTVLPGLFAFACLPIASFYLQHSFLQPSGISLLAAIVLFAHRKNIGSEISQLLNRGERQPQENPPTL